MDDRERALRELLREAAFDLSTQSASVWYGPVHTVETRHGAFVDLVGTKADVVSAAFCQVVAHDGDTLEVTDECAYLGHPIAIRGRVVGAVCVVDREPRSFSALERRRLIALAHEMGEWLGALAGHALPRSVAA